MWTWPDLFWLLLTSLFCASGQLCLKKGADMNAQRGLLRGLFHPWTLAGIALMLANVLTFVWVLRRLSLSVAMPFAALVYILVPCGAQIFFRERLRPVFWLGAALIGLGIVITACA